MPVSPDELWKVSFRMLMPQFVEFFFPQHYNKIDWQKEIVFLDKELQTIQPNSRPKNRIKVIQEKKLKWLIISSKRT